jgi:hypothetical protein
MGVRPRSQPPSTAIAAKAFAIADTRNMRHEDQ